MNKSYKGKVVLIADDDTLISNALSEECKSKDLTVHVVHDSQSFISFIEKGDVKPDVVFLDILMPGKTGVELLVDIKRIDSTLLEKTIIMTSLDGSNYVSEAIENGAIYYVSKNTSDLSQLMDTLDKILSK